MAEIQSFRRVLIVADESADWMVAGLRQLDRLALSVDEFAVENKETAPVLVCIFWRPDLDQSQRWVPKNERLTRVAFTTDLDGQPFDLVLNTRLFLYRKAVRQLMEASASPSEIIFPISEKELWESYFRQVESLPRFAGRGVGIHHGREPDRRDRDKIPARQRQVPGRFRLPIFESSDLARGDAPSPEIPHHSERVDLVDLSDSDRRIAHSAPRHLLVVSLGSRALSGLQRSGRLRRRDRAREISWRAKAGAGSTISSTSSATFCSWSAWDLDFPGKRILPVIPDGSTSLKESQPPL